MEDKLLTVAEASKIAGVSTESIRRWTNTGKLKTYRSGGNHRRIKTSDLMRLIDVNGHLKIPTFGHEKPAHLAI